MLKSLLKYFLGLGYLWVGILGLSLWHKQHVVFGLFSAILGAVIALALGISLILEGMH